MTVDDLHFPVMLFEDDEFFVMYNAGGFTSYSAHGIERNPPYQHSLIIDSSGKACYTTGVRVGAPIPRPFRERFSAVSMPMVQIEVMFSDEPVEYTIDDLKQRIIAKIKGDLHILAEGVNVGNGLLVIKRAQTIQELIAVADTDTFTTLDEIPEFPVEITGQGVTVFSRPITPVEQKAYPRPFQPGIGTLGEVALILFLGFGFGLFPFVAILAVKGDTEEAFKLATGLFLLTNGITWITGTAYFRRDRRRKKVILPSIVNVLRLSPVDLIQVRTNCYAFEDGYVLQLGQDRLVFLSLGNKTLPGKQFEMIFFPDHRLLNIKTLGKKVEPSQVITFDEGHGFFPEDPIIMPGRIDEVEELLRM